MNMQRVRNVLTYGQHYERLISRQTYEEYATNNGKWESFLKNLKSKTKQQKVWHQITI